MSKKVSTLRFLGAFLRPTIARSIIVTTVLCSAGANLLGEDSNKRGCAPLPSGAVSWWPGDGNTDDIVGSNNGQLNGGAKFAPGFVGEAFKFDGIDDYFQSAANGLPESSTDRTLEMWVKLDSVLPPDLTTSEYFEDFFAGYGQPGYLGEFFELYSEYEPPYGNALAWSQWFDQLVGPQLHHGEPFQPNRGWHHVAVTLTSSSNIGIVLFLDGVPVARRQNFQIDTPDGTSFLMGRIPGANGDIRRMRGEIDEVTVYNRALLPDEIVAIFLAGKSGKCKP
jgi:Concanavalin A-like lectin/glucanases superfamily